MKEYRIGDYAKYLGVTPDLLKHYEACGLISPTRSPSGYRYYPFSTSSLLIESIRLRNYGLTLREITDILVRQKADTSDMEKRFSANIEILREECRLNLALVEDYEEFLQWKVPLKDRTHDWSIRWSSPMYFLPHAESDTFLDDLRIYEILKDWMSHIPIVKSSLRISSDGRKTWGLLVEKRKLQALQLPLNDVVTEIPSQKVFYYQFRGTLTPRSEEKADPDVNPALSLIRSMGLSAGTTIFRTSLMPCDWKQGIRYQYGYYAIPLEEK